MSEKKSEMQQYFGDFTASDIAFVVAANEEYRTGDMNFRMIRGLVSQRVDIERPLRGHEVEELIELCEERVELWNRDALTFDTSKRKENRKYHDDLLNEARAVIKARMIDIGFVAIPHVSIYEPRADDFKEAAALGMTGGIVDRALYLDELRDRENVLAKLGVAVRRATVEISQIKTELAYIQGKPNVPADVAAAAEIVAFPKKRSEIRNARGWDPNFSAD